jgi:multidrug resistance efflux pump
VILKPPISRFGGGTFETRGHAVDSGRRDCERADALHAGRDQPGRATANTQQSSDLQAVARAGWSVFQAAADAIVGPFSGVVGERYVNAGEYVQANTRVASMYSLDPVRITISVRARRRPGAGA